MRWFLLIMFFILLPAAYSLKLYDIDCFDDGHVEMTLEGINESRAYTKDIVVKIDSNTVQGSWSSFFIKKSESSQDKYGVFTSREGIFNTEKDYDIDVDYLLIENATAQYKQSLQVSVSCPGLRFSCSLLNLSIKDCYTKDNKFSAVITANGLKQSSAAEMDMGEVTSYIVTARENYLNKNNINSKKGELPAAREIIYLKNDDYLLTFNFENNFVESLFVSFNNELFLPCSEPDYEFKRYDLMVCGESTKEIIKMPQEPAKQEILAEEKSTEEAHIEQPVEVAEEKPPAAPESQPEQKGTAEDEEINPKTILMVAFIILIIGAIMVYLLKQRDII